VVDGNVIDDGVIVSAVVPELAPVPERATVWGDPVALSAKETAPVTVPAAAGTKPTVTVQVEPAGRGLGQFVD
jgi:hypothetical protein